MSKSHEVCGLKKMCCLTSIPQCNCGIWSHQWVVARLNALNLREGKQAVGTMRSIVEKEQNIGWIWGENYG